VADLYQLISDKLTELIEPIVDKKEEIEDLL